MTGEQIIRDSKLCLCCLKGHEVKQCRSQQMCQTGHTEFDDRLYSESLRNWFNVETFSIHASEQQTDGDPPFLRLLKNEDHVKYSRIINEK